MMRLSPRGTLHDAGAIQMANNYAGTLKATTVVVEKGRKAHREETVAKRVIGDVAGRNVLIVDDFTTTGSTLVSTAELLRADGATKGIYAAVTHGVLAAGSANRIERSPIKELVITDTVEHRFEPLPKSVKVVSVARLLARAIRNIHDQTSVSALFDF